MTEQLEHFGIPCELPDDGYTGEQCDICDDDLYDYEETTCDKCERTICKECEVKCEKCGELGCKKCFIKNDEGWFCSEECR